MHHAHSQVLARARTSCCKIVDWLLQVLNARRGEIMEDVLDLLMSFVDFQAFKELMLTHKLDSGLQHMQVIAATRSMINNLKLMYCIVALHQQCYVTDLASYFAQLHKVLDKLAICCSTALPATQVLRCYWLLGWCAQPATSETPTCRM